MVDVESFPCRLELETGRLSRGSFRVVGSSSRADDSVEVDGVGVLAVGRVHDCYVDIVAFYDSEHGSWNSAVKGPVAVRAAGSAGVAWGSRTMVAETLAITSATMLMADSIRIFLSGFIAGCRFGIH